MVALVIITLLSCVTHVISTFQCHGTCYSGSFPKNKQVIKGERLRGYSYRNITTDVPHTCFSSCITDCRCKAFQMKDVKCELLDEDKNTKAADFEAETGYVYYDLQQTFFNAKYHTEQPGGVCYNGCCTSKPCMNGGTCVEHCYNPKNKFTCNCLPKFYGKMCEMTINSCIDVLKGSSPGTISGNGTYTITRSDTKTTIPVYCAFEAPNQAWTLIESFSLQNNAQFRGYAFHEENFRNRDSPNWEDYRMLQTNMQYIRTKASLFRATCDYPNRDSLTPDFLLGLLSHLDIMSSVVSYNYCPKYLHVNIIGKECFNCTARSFKKTNEHFHIDTSTMCYLHVNTDSTDYFGFYGTTKTNTKCTATSQSTTQWWLGEEQ